MRDGNTVAGIQATIAKHQNRFRVARGVVAAVVRPGENEVGGHPAHLDFGVLTLSNSTDNANTFLLTDSLLYRYGSNVKIWRCPGDRSVSTHGGATYPRVRALAMNRWMSEGRLSASPGYRVYKKSSDLTVPGPANTRVFIDEREDSIHDAYFAVNMTGYPDQPRTITWVNYPASCHNNATGLAFADGRSPLKILSPDNQDLVWLQQRTTAKN